MTVDVHSLRARTAIFGRLRAQAGTAESPVPLPKLDDWRRHPAIPAGESLIDAFRRNALGWRAEVIDANTDDWPQVCAHLLRDHDLLPAITGHDSLVARALAPLLPVEQLARPVDPMAALKPALFNEYRAGVIGTVGGIAETGSLIVWPGAAEPRSLSLIPPVCLAVLFASRLFPDFDRAMRELHWADDMPTNTLLVTGPSKTADIQRLLVYGAHGPRRLLIVLVDDTGAAP